MSNENTPAAKEQAKPAKEQAKPAKEQAKPAKKPAKPSTAAKAGARARAKAEAKLVKPTPAPKPKAEPKPAEPFKARAKPKLDAEAVAALGARAAKKAVQPRFRRHEWWRYKRLGGKHASWRLPRGIHSKTRRHWGYRPPVVSIGYRGPASVRGLHPSGFEEVLVHTPAELAQVNAATQAARVGGTVGGRKAKLIEAEAAKLGVRILNPRGEA